MRAFAWVPLFVSLAACTSGGTITSAIPATQDASSRARAVGEGFAAHPKPIAPRPDGSNALLYVGNVGNNSITVYHHDQQGNTAPVAVIAGPDTQITNPGQLSQDRQGNLYVANGRADSFVVNPAAVLVFAHGATGNVKPIRVLTGIPGITAMTVDQSTGELFVAQIAQMFGQSQLLRFAPNASGSQAPVAASQDELYPGIQLASDSTGKYIIEDHFGDAGDSDTGVDVYPKRFANNANLETVHGIADTSGYGLADDPTTKTYLLTDGAITRFAETTDTRVVPGTPETLVFVPPVVSIITSDTCGAQLALDSLRSIYVTHSVSGDGFIGGCTSDAVVVYEHDATGNAAPLRILSGPATKLNEPYGIFVGI